MIFYKKVELYSELTIEQMNNILKTNVKSFDSTKNITYDFEGKIFDNEFLIYPIFNYGYREQLRPLIHGVFFKHNNLNRLSIEFKLPIGTKFLLILSFLLVNILIVIMMTFPSLIPIQIWHKWWVLLLILIITFIIFLNYFNYKVNKSINILKNKLKAT